MSPISEIHASTIISLSVSFGFWQFECSPTHISKEIGITPDEMLCKGETRTLRNGHEIPVSWNSWSIYSSSESKDINDHFRELLQRMEGKNKSIKKEWNPSFNVVWKSDYLYAGNGPFYELDVLKGIVLFQAELYQDIYQIEPNEQTET